MEMNLTPEQIEKAKGAKSPEELLALAKESGFELSPEQANDYFEQINASGELSDDELDNVAGGGCGKEKYPRTPAANRCAHWRCPACDKVESDPNVHKHICRYYDRTVKCEGCYHYYINPETAIPYCKYPEIGYPVRLV